MPNFVMNEDSITIDTGGDPGEVLRVKRLPGRRYDPDLEVWVIPILPGLGAALEAVYGEEAGGELAALIEAEEKNFLASLEVPGPVDPFKIGIVEACNIALTYHLYAMHDGDRGKYNKVHWPFMFGE